VKKWQLHPLPRRPYKPTTLVAGWGGKTLRYEQFLATIIKKLGKTGIETQEFFPH
jgi:hypothetical protein